jgi:quinoprotein glucose dehydrogenase
MLAGIALGRMADEASIDALITAIRNNSDRDVFLRHGLVMGLAGCATDTVLMAHASDASPAVRRAVVLALRKHISPEMARFLDDSDLHVVAEAARGIYDLNIAAAMPALADRLNRPLPRGDVGVQNAVFRRAIAANEQLGTPAAAQTLAAFVAEAAVNATMRRVALASVEHFAQARLREPVHNYHRPHDARSPQIIVDTLAPRMPVLMSSIKDEKVLSLLMHVAASLQIKPDAAELLKWIADEKRSNDLRLQSLDSLVQMKWDRLPEAIDAAIASRSQALRTAARRQLVTSDPARALTELVRATQQGETAEKQAAWPMLATLGNEAADAAIGSAMDDLIAGKLAPEQQLDVLQAARSRPTLAAKVQAYDASLSAGDPLSAYRFALLGGDAKKGREVFESHALAQCMRCHKINDEGGDAGPDLSKLAAHSTPESRLESLINPGAVITPGYGTVVITTHSGQTFAGTLKAEDPQRVTLLTTDGMETSIRLTEIATRSPAVSAMPPMGMLLPPNDLRDLLAYLSTLK